MLAIKAPEHVGHAAHPARKPLGVPKPNRIALAPCVRAVEEGIQLVAAARAQLASLHLDERE
eukprot:774547-Lingulodinium_polyedra.AAC.1